MNLRAYYQKIRAIEESLLEPFIVVASHETADGGKEGVLTEVPKRLAAKMIADGQAHVASEEAAKDFYERKAGAKRTADQEAVTAKMQVTLVPTDSKKVNRGAKD
jgi:hypothetical protein